MCLVTSSYSFILKDAAVSGRWLGVGDGANKKEKKVFKGISQKIDIMEKWSWHC